MTTSLLHNSPPPAPEPPTRSTSTIQCAAVIVHLYWGRPAAAEHCWQRVMPGRQLSKQCPVSRTESEQQYNGKSVQTDPFSLLPRRKSTQRGNKNPFMCMYQVNYLKLWIRGHWLALTVWPLSYIQLFCHDDGLFVHVFALRWVTRETLSP